MIREGRVFLDLELPEVISSEMGVFYNPHMRENRDISLLMLLCLPQEELLVCDPMGASGVRLMRFLLETDRVKKAVYNDISQEAVNFFKGMLQRHAIPEEQVEVHQEDACLLLRRLRNCHYVDIDPFGSPVPFLESGILPVARHGMLAVTATDTSVLSGTYPETCMRRYGSRPLLSAEFYHEVGVRILIKKVLEEGAKMDYALRPVFSYSYRHYFRIFFIKDIGPRRTDSLFRKIGFLLYCPKCLYRDGAGLDSIGHQCPHCGGSLLLAGPLWLGELWDRELVHRLWEIRGRVDISDSTNRLLDRIRRECECDTLGFYTISSLCRAFRIGQSPSIERFLEVFKGVRTHFTPEGFRTRLSHREVLERVNELLQRA
ncbi:MAG: tRNA (guanine(26)-N(2))-dimethyltransferase [Aquificaceae bacterium]|uniref:tRNA (guanine(26)-N(2))-dimethyltransferase n=1 Tax=Hydrogenobacter sp. Uz 6-8 TaxID=3384828 RepID=UPI0030B2BE8D